MAEEDKGLWETIKPDMVKLLTVGVLGLFFLVRSALRHGCATSVSPD
jgi:hypothetical protein